MYTRQAIDHLIRRFTVRTYVVTTSDDESPGRGFRRNHWEPITVLTLFAEPRNNPSDLQEHTSTRPPRSQPANRRVNRFLDPSPAAVGLAATRSRAASIVDPCPLMHSYRGEGPPATTIRRRVQTHLRAIRCFLRPERAHPQPIFAAIGAAAKAGAYEFGLYGETICSTNNTSTDFNNIPRTTFAPRSLAVARNRACGVGLIYMVTAY